MADQSMLGATEEYKTMSGYVNQAIGGAVGGAESLLNFRIFHCSS